MKIHVFFIRRCASFLTISTKKKTNSHLFLVSDQYSRTSIKSMPMLDRLYKLYTSNNNGGYRLLLLLFFFWPDICYFHLPHICVLLMLCYVPLNILLLLYSIEVSILL